MTVGKPGILVANHVARRDPRTSNHVARLADEEGLRDYRLRRVGLQALLDSVLPVGTSLEAIPEMLSPAYHLPWLDELTSVAWAKTQK